MLIVCVDNEVSHPSNAQICGSSDDTLKLTDVYTFIGILCVSPSVFSLVASQLNYALTQNLGSATSLHDGNQDNVPTLHVLFSYPHPPTIVRFPYPMQSALPTEVTQYNMQETEGPPGSQALTDIRSELIDWLATEGLAGDREAAQWILLLAGPDHSRTPPILPLSVALSSFPPPPSTPSTSAKMPVLEPTLNSCSFSHFVECGPSSVLPRGTTVLVSDGAVSEGTLNNTGVLNVQALKQCISLKQSRILSHTVDFTFNTELTFLVLTQDKKSPFVETDVNVPLRPTLESSRFALYKAADRIRLPAPEKLRRFRELIGGAKTGKVTVGDDVSEYIQTDFVRQRQQVQGINSDDLVLRMSVARLMTLSFHELEMTKDTWEKTKALDNNESEDFWCSSPICLIIRLAV
ncbi:hypothetical protein BS47DRAFT_1399926 [Hydnum rufescens UP504]|uniref:Mini-chromosome maintenance complex-binding protein n=1 Tax=Hydnum rufescens UP504 TaxID=1448309 RepID=A0A9P6DP68_9AGAM|nr:hypothetical protein BS47DRAFT_1399926 [Hydnum rufescens UP504]